MSEVSSPVQRFERFWTELWRARLTVQQFRVAEVFAEWSLKEGFESVRITSNVDLGLALWMAKGDVGETIAQLCSKRVFTELGECLWRPNTDSSYWQVEWRWQTAAARDRGDRMREALRKYQQRELTAEDRGLDAVIGTLEISSDDGGANCPAGTQPGTSHRGNASLLSMAVSPGTIRVVRTRIASLLRKKGWDEVAVAGVEVMPVEQLRRVWANHPELERDGPGLFTTVSGSLTERVSESLTAAVSESLTDGRVARASNRSNGTNGTTVHSIDCGDMSRGGEWLVDEDLMRRVREVVGAENAGYWFTVLKNAGQHGAWALHEALCEWKLRGGAPPKDASRYLGGIYRRFLNRANHAAKSAKP